MSLISKAIFSSLVLFGGSFFLTFKYDQFQKYDETLKTVQSQNKLRSFLYEIHKKTQESKEILPNTSLPKESHYREVLLSYAEGDLLEMGIGLTNNEKYYPYNVNKIIAIDWVKKCIEMGYINNKLKKRSFLLEDCENLTFEDNTFDSVADIFSLQYYSDPLKALKEMQRVCKNDGKILVLAQGRSFYKVLNNYLDFKNPKSVCQQGNFINRDWTEIIEKLGFEIIRSERKVNGSLYFYVLKNKK